MRVHALHRLLFAILLLLPTMLLLSGAQISDFHARRENDAVVVEWATLGETNLDRFALERSSDTINWNAVADIPARPGDTSSKREYSYLDRSIFKDDGSGTFYYRLYTVDHDGTSTPHSVITSIQGSSGIRHTWGSIKAIFR